MPQCMPVLRVEQYRLLPDQMCCRRLVNDQVSNQAGIKSRGQGLNLVFIGYDEQTSRHPEQFLSTQSGRPLIDSQITHAAVAAVEGGGHIPHYMLTVEFFAIMSGQHSRTKQRTWRSPVRSANRGYDQIQGTAQFQHLTNAGLLPHHLTSFTGIEDGRGREQMNLSVKCGAKASENLSEIIFPEGKRIPKTMKLQNLYTR